MLISPLFVAKLSSNRPIAPSPTVVNPSKGKSQPKESKSIPHASISPFSNPLDVTAFTTVNRPYNPSTKDTSPQAVPSSSSLVNSFSAYPTKLKDSDDFSTSPAPPSPRFVFTPQGSSTPTKISANEVPSVIADPIGNEKPILPLPLPARAQKFRAPPACVLTPTPASTATAVVSVSSKGPPSPVSPSPIPVFVSEESPKSPSSPSSPSKGKKFAILFPKRARAVAKGMRLKEKVFRVNVKSASAPAFPVQETEVNSPSTPVSAFAALKLESMSTEHVKDSSLLEVSSSVFKVSAKTPTPQVSATVSKSSEGCTESLTTPVQRTTLPAKDIEAQVQPTFVTSTQEAQSTDWISEVPPVPVAVVSLQVHSPIATVALSQAAPSDTTTVLAPPTSSSDAAQNPSKAQFCTVIPAPGKPSNSQQSEEQLDVEMTGKHHGSIDNRI